VFGRHRRKDKLLFGLSDVLLTLLAFELAYRARVSLPLERVFFLVTPTKVLLMASAAALWPLAGSWLKVYARLDAERFPVLLRETFKQCFLSGIGLVLVEYTLRIDLSRPFLAIFVACNFLLLMLFRVNAPWVIGWFRRGFGTPYYVFIAGSGPRARKLGRQIEQSASWGVRLTGFIAVDGSTSQGEIVLKEHYPVYPLDRLSELLDGHVIDEIIFAVDSRMLSELEDTLLLCDEDGVRTCVAVDFFPHVNSDVYLDRLQNTPLLSFSTTPHDEVLLLLKRVLDVFVAAVGLILLSPFILLTVLLIRITSPGPAIFSQERCGLNGRRFTFFKFRSMVQDAEQLQASLEHLNEKSTAFKISNDPRVTPMGKVLRKFSIDEWPQLWNVLKGDMSLVGPRPPVPAEVEKYERWQKRRLRMRPGLTCLWALEGRDALDFESWMKKDLEYIDTWSLGLDAQILLKTVPHVLSGKGAH
jgi:exopolysaccharide biosynthesis polyprenyl glycosylphosphotransferase